MLLSEAIGVLLACDLLGEGEPGVCEGGPLVDVVHIHHLVPMLDDPLPAKWKLCTDTLLLSCPRVGPLR